MSRCSAGSGGVSAREGGDSAASWTARMGRRGSVRARGAGHRREGDRPQRRRTYRGSACQHDQHGRQTRRACVARDDLIENHKVEYACHETAAVPTHHARVDDATVTPLESPWPLVRDASFWHGAFAPTPPDSVNTLFRFLFSMGYGCEITSRCQTARLTRSARPRSCPRDRPCRSRARRGGRRPCKTRPDTPSRRCTADPDSTPPRRCRKADKGPRCRNGSRCTQSRRNTACR